MTDNPSEEVQRAVALAMKTHGVVRLEHKVPRPDHDTQGLWLGVGVVVGMVAAFSLGLGAHYGHGMTVLSSWALALLAFVMPSAAGAVIGHFAAKETLYVRLLTTDPAQSPPLALPENDTITVPQLQRALRREIRRAKRQKRQEEAALVETNEILREAGVVLPGNRAAAGGLSEPEPEPQHGPSGSEETSP